MNLNKIKRFAVESVMEGGKCFISADRTCPGVEAPASEKPSFEFKIGPKLDPWIDDNGIVVDLLFAHGTEQVVVPWEAIQMIGNGPGSEGSYIFFKKGDSKPITPPDDPGPHRGVPIPIEPERTNVIDFNAYRKAA